MTKRGNPIVYEHSHDPRCSLGDNGISRTQLARQLCDLLDRAGWDSLDLDDDGPAGLVDQDALDALPQGAELLLR